MKVYLQARYCRIEEMREVAKRFEARGHTVVSSWIHGPTDEAPTQEAAIMDVREVMDADVAVHFAEPTHSSGRYFELGVAYATGKTCIVVGQGKCVFYGLPDILRADDVDGALDILGPLGRPVETER